VVGTHALLYGKIDLRKLALIIVDEQHRFGVKQRAVLREGQAILPHMISMTATPIPRTLALTLFADLAVAHLSGKPAGRQPVVTTLVKSKEDRVKNARTHYERVRNGTSGVCGLSSYCSHGRE